MSFVRAPNPIWYMPDLIGQPLNDEYYIFFLENTFPYNPQTVYTDPQGIGAWLFPLQFEPAGTLPNNLYFDPNLVYRIEVRHGPLQSDDLIYEINDFVPGESNINPNNLSILSTDNLASNSVFAEVYFTAPIGSSLPTLTIATAGTYDIAPGWQLLLEGTGSVTLTQIMLTGNQNQISNPPFALRVVTSGSWTKVYLFQRFSMNGAIWRKGAVTMSIVGNSNVNAETVTLIYLPNENADIKEIASGLLPLGGYDVLGDAVNLDPSTNNVDSNDAYVDFIISLPLVGSVDISSVQIIGQTLPLADPTTIDIPPYQQESYERMVDHLFHLYRTNLIEKPKANLLTGWNFPLNPYQFIDSTVSTVAAQTSYVADQTILYQNAASQLLTGKNLNAERGNFVVLAAAGATDTRFALIQYIDPKTIKPYWSYIVSAFSRMRIVSLVNNTPVRVKMRLIYSFSLPLTLSPTEPIASWTLGDDPTFSGVWTPIAPLNDPAYILPNEYDSDENTYQGFAYNQFQLPNGDTDNMTLGVVIYTMDNLHSVAGEEDYVEFDKISLIQSDFGADAAAETWDESLRKCQFYYEKSYEIPVLPGTATAIGAKFANQFIFTDTGIGNSELYPTSFSCDFMQVKRIIPTVDFYSSSTGTVDFVYAQIEKNNVVTASGDIAAVAPAASPKWELSTTYLSTERFIMIARLTSTAVLTAVATGVLGDNGLVTYQYSADARMGI